MPVAGVQVSQPASSSAVFRCGSACAAPAGDRRFSCLLKSVSSWARCHIHHLYLHSCIVSMSIAISSTRPFAGVLTPARRPLTRRAVKVAFKITFKTPEGDKTMECPDDTYILDAADAAGIDLPYSCRSGTCSSCAGKIVKGSVDQSEQQMLNDEQLAAGYALLCVSYPQSDLVIETDKESEVMG